MVYSVKNSNVGLTGIPIFLAAIWVRIIFFNWYLRRKNFFNRLVKYWLWYVILSLPLFIILQLLNDDAENYNKTNKSVWFYTHSIEYFLNKETPANVYSAKDAKEFQQLSPSKKFTGTEFPLLHQLDTTYTTDNYFQRFDSAPNIVILIVEGLNDDFIHQYQGVNLMPFLSELKDKSLYWNRCFTLGERSFAVVPSILGGLPYGEKGFTLQDILPIHLSLVSLLHANNYYTSFFYGQGAWFHRKNRFFTFNNIDNITDNSCYSNKYKKIIVGKEHFFWGYNDMDLFNQSFEVIDTLPEKMRLDIYFTGTSHSPFAIENDSYYSKRLEELKNGDNEKFVDTYQKYLKSLLFVDDALANFFHQYEKRKEFRNTLFLITGDHPMTELPRGNSLKRYHVPLIIYSDKLVKPQVVTDITSHMDVPEGIISLLRTYLHQLPTVSSSLGDNLFNPQCRNNKWVVFMDDNRNIIDFYYNGYYKSGKSAYLVDSNLHLTKITDKNINKRLNQELVIFKKTNQQVCLEDKIIDDSLFCKSLNCEMIASKRSKDAVSFQSEYYNLIPEKEIQNEEIIFNISFQYKSYCKDLSLVYQLTDSTGKVIYWKSCRITKKENLFEEHIKIPAQQIDSPTLKFATYFWKRDQKELLLYDLRILIYQKNATGTSRRQNIFQ
jgi:phosphoglycerol transferase MdoB-like AlkP superfamily enzyme